MNYRLNFKEHEGTVWILQAQTSIWTKLHVSLMLTLKRKVGYFTSKKIDLFGNNRKLQVGTCKLWQNYKQVQQPRQRNFIL